MGATIARNNCSIDLVLLIELTNTFGVAEKKASMSLVLGAVVSGGRDHDKHHSPAEVWKKRGCKIDDVGSSKRPKKTRYIDLHQEFKKEARVTLGVVRSSQFVGGDDRYLIVTFGLVDSANSIVALRQKPFWVRPCDSWVRGLLTRGLRNEPIVVD